MIPTTPLALISIFHAIHKRTYIKLGVTITICDDFFMPDFNHQSLQISDDFTCMVNYQVVLKFQRERDRESAQS